MVTVASSVVVLLALLLHPAPAAAQGAGSIAYRVNLVQVPSLESLRRLVEGCTDLGALESHRGALAQAPDLEQLRPRLASLGVVRLGGCSQRVQGIPGVSPLGGLLPEAEAEAKQMCKTLEGARLFNTDDEYFGTITGPAGADSIFNRLGSYGNTTSPSSIWNRFGVGGQLRSDSPWNPFSRGLTIARNDAVLGQLTVNATVQNWLHPLALAATCFGIGDRADPNT